VQLDGARGEARPNSAARLGSLLATAGVAVLLIATPASAADPRKDTPISLPRRASETTLINLGAIALSMHTENIVLGAADGPGALGFAASPRDGMSSVTGSARAMLSLTLNLGALLPNESTHIPLPLKTFSSAAKASLSLAPGGKLSLTLGSSWGIGGSRSAGPDLPRSSLKLNINPLHPWKHASIGWHLTF
jgi:hypothetical protein